MQPERPNLGSIGWYAVRTKAKHEKSVAAHLQGKDIVQFLPLYQSWHRSGGRIQSVQLPLFKGYVFCRFDPLDRLPILITPGVSFILGRGKEPEPVPDSEVEYIRASCESGLPITPWPYIELGERVRVELGPLQGVEGVFVKEKKTCRLVVSVQMLQRAVAVEVERDWVRPVLQRDYR